MADGAQIGFIGIGKMGLPLVEQLRRAGHEVTAFDPVPENLSAARLLGCHAAKSLIQCASSGSVLMTSLPDDAALYDVAQEALPQMMKGSIFVDTSTVSPAISANVAALAGVAGVRYIRACVSGNPGTARAGALTAMVSGPAEAWSEVKPLFDTFSKTQFYLGDAEQARVAKLVINLMIAVSAGMMAEALALGAKGGLDWQQMLELMGKSAVGSPMVNYKIPPLAKHDYSSTFSGVQMIKDLDLILGEGARTGVPLQLTAQMRQAYETIRAQGEGELDYIATVRLMARMAGITQDKL